MADLSLTINNQPVAIYSASLVFSIEQLAHTFDCMIEPFKIDQPYPVEFKLSNTTILVGQIDISEDSSHPEKSQIKIKGRSSTANLIDSRIKVDAIYGQTLEQLLAKIAGEFGLDVKSNVQGNLSEVPEFQINAESPLSNLAQIAKQQNLILKENNGTIEIEKPGQFEIENILLEEGKNIQNLSITRNWANQFFHYEVQGAWDNAEAIVKYDAANANRKKVIISDKLQDQKSCQQRAEYERDLAIAKSLTVTGTIPGLHAQLTGASLNKMMQVVSPFKEFNEKLLLKTLTLSISAESESSQVEFYRPFKEVVL